MISSSQIKTSYETNRRADRLKRRRNVKVGKSDERTRFYYESRFLSKSFLGHFSFQFQLTSNCLLYSLRTACSIHALFRLYSWDFHLHRIRTDSIGFTGYHLQMSPYISIRGCVRRSVLPLFHPSVHSSVFPSVCPYVHPICYQNASLVLLGLVSPSGYTRVSPILSIRGRTDSCIVIA